jgi:predicted regulator of Ras-like GTPase activity (Roadblock/LC7/MglB family)
MEAGHNLSVINRRNRPISQAQDQEGILCPFCPGRRYVAERRAMTNAMNLSELLLQESEYQRLRGILAKTQKDLHADLVLLIDRAGHEIASEGTGLSADHTALASLAAANLAATEELARLVGETDFSIIYHQGRHRSIHISDVARRLSLVLVFDDAVSLGMVRWKVKRATAALEEVLLRIPPKSKSATAAGQAPGSPPVFTDAEIDRLIRHFAPKADVEGKV